MLGAFSVNGAPCELLVEQDALSWWPRSGPGGGTSSLPSPVRQLRRLSRGALSDGGDKPRADVPRGAGKTEEPQKHLRRVDFNQIIGVRRVHIKRRARLKGRASERAGQETTSDETQPTSTTEQAGDSEIRETKQAGEPAHVYRLKIYYAKRNEKKSTGRLLKLKKITLGLLEHSHDIARSRHQRADAFQTSPATSTSSPSPPSSPSQDKSSQPDSSCALEGLHDLIEQHLELKRRQRPRRLLVFVNPYGGKGRAMHLYKSRVRKIFDLAQIDCQLVVTKYANHARNTIEDPMFKLECFDGIICIGGDGMFAELMNGLLFRCNRDKLLASELDSLNRRASDQLSISDNSSQINASESAQQQSIGRRLESSLDSEASKKYQMERQIRSLRSSLGGIGEQFQSPNIPIGVIGAGSTDANLFGFIGTNDTVSATLNIALGSQIRIDVCSVHSVEDDRLLRFVSTFVAYGYFGDVIRESEKLRWLGPSRYDLTALNSLIKYRCYNGLVKILRSRRDGTPLDVNRCHLNCTLCNQTGSNRHESGLSDMHRAVRLTSSCEFGDKAPVEGGETKDERTSMAGYRQDSVQGGADDEFEILEEEGSFMGVNAAVTACRCPQTRKGFSPSNHLANGCADLILVRPCSRMQYINYLLRTGYTSKSAFDLRYVDAYRCRQFEFIVQQPQAPAGGRNDARATDDLATSDYQSKGSARLSTNDTSVASSRQSSNTNSLDSKLCASHEIGFGLPGQEPVRPASERQQQQNAGTKTAAFAPLNNGLEGCNHELTDELVNSSWNADGEILREQSIRVKVNNKLLRVFGTGEPQPRTRAGRKQQHRQQSG